MALTASLISWRSVLYGSPCVPRHRDSIGSSMDQRAVGYVRVSTASQVSEGISLDEQESSIRHFAEQQGLRLTHVFREEGVSGHSLRRPQLDALREALRRRETDILVVRHIDRLTRRGLDLKELLEELDGLGVRLMTTEDRYGGLVGFDSRRDRAVFEAVITFAEWQRDRLSSATKAAPLAPPSIR